MPEPLVIAALSGRASGSPKAPGVEAITPGALIVLASAICYGASNVMVKSLTRTESAFVIVFFMQIVQLPLGLVPALFDWTQPGLLQLPWIILVGVTAIGAHYGMARAFALVDASVILPVDFMRLPIVALLGVVLYGRTGRVRVWRYDTEVGRWKL